MSPCVCSNAWRSSDTNALPPAIARWQRRTNGIRGALSGPIADTVGRLTLHVAGALLIVAHFYAILLCRACKANGFLRRGARRDDARPTLETIVQRRWGFSSEEVPGSRCVRLARYGAELERVSLGPETAQYNVFSALGVPCTRRVARGLAGPSQHGRNARNLYDATPAGGTFQQRGACRTRGAP